jgi:hypothetical protein
MTQAMEMVNERWAPFFPGLLPASAASPFGEPRL